MPQADVPNLNEIHQQKQRLKNKHHSYLHRLTNVLNIKNIIGTLNTFFFYRNKTYNNKCAFSMQFLCTNQNVKFTEIKKHFINTEVND